MIVRRQLRMAAVGMDLPARLLDEHIPAEPDTPRAGRQFGQRASSHVQRERLAGEVRVGAEVAREVLLDVRELPIERDEQIDDPGLFVFMPRSTREHLECPEPAQTAERELQHARPVGADERRIGLQPALELRDEAPVEAAIS